MSRAEPAPRCPHGCLWIDHEKDGRCGRDCLWCPSDPCSGHQTRNVNRYNPQRSFERERQS